MKKVIWSIVLSWVCLAFAAAGIGTRDAVSACDGKVYKKGDKIMFGVPKVSGYLFISFSKSFSISLEPISEFRILSSTLMLSTFL
mgnify:CR=1 FL=1